MLKTWNRECPCAEQTSTHLDRDALLAVDRVARVHVAGDQGVVLALGDEDALVTVLLNDNLGSALGTAATAATTTATATTACKHQRAPISRGGPGAATKRRWETHRHGRDRRHDHQGRLGCHRGHRHGRRHGRRGHHRRDWRLQDRATIQQQQGQVLQRSRKSTIDSPRPPPRPPNEPPRPPGAPATAGRTQMSRFFDPGQLPRRSIAQALRTRLSRTARSTTIHFAFGFVATHSLPF